MSQPPPEPSPPAAVRDAAARWLASRDRGLTPREQEQYLRWLAEDERHREAIAEAEATLRRMMQLPMLLAELPLTPEPDLFAPPHGRRWMPWLAAAAVILIGLGSWARFVTAPANAVAIHRQYLHMNERRYLPDGSQAELKDGSRLEVRYSATERRVCLSGGEAQFSVMKDPTRPFVVEAGGVAVRAVGTVFDVRLSGREVNVLVTEGKVRVGLAAAEPGRIFRPHAPDQEPPTVAAGQRAVVALTESAPAPVVADVSTEEIRRDLAWQAPRLQFDETPLTEAVAEFNRCNRRQLVLSDPRLGDLHIGGSFRPDNVDGFVRLLSVTLGIRAEARGPNETVLVREK